MTRHSLQLICWSAWVKMIILHYTHTLGPVREYYYCTLAIIFANVCLYVLHTSNWRQYSPHCENIWCLSAPKIFIYPNNWWLVQRCVSVDRVLACIFGRTLIQHNIWAVWLLIFWANNSSKRWRKSLGTSRRCITYPRRSLVFVHDKCHYNQEASSHNIS